MIGIKDYCSEDPNTLNIKFLLKCITAFIFISRKTNEIFQKEWRQTKYFARYKRLSSSEAWLSGAAIAYFYPSLSEVHTLLFLTFHMWLFSSLVYTSTPESIFQKSVYPPLGRKQRMECKSRHQGCWLKNNPTSCTHIIHKIILIWCQDSQIKCILY